MPASRSSFVGAFRFSDLETYIGRTPRHLGDRLLVTANGVATQLGQDLAVEFEVAAASTGSATSTTYPGRGRSTGGPAR